MKNLIKKTILFTFVIIISCVSGLAGSFTYSTFFRNRSTNLNDILTSDIKVVNEESAIIEVAKTASESVVSIVITKDLPKYENYYYNPFENDPFFEDYQIPGRRQNGTEEVQIGAGTGFIVTNDGMIITNKHVVADTDASYTVILNNEEKYDAQVIARDTLLDIAFVKIEAKDLKPLKLGTSQNLKVGQSVIAIGNSLGEFSNTVSAGIISGLSRNIIAGDASGNNPEELHDVIQTDASINPGNSGGPLLDIEGNVIGVNVAVAQSAENIGFAIPVDVVNDLLKRLNEDGSIERPILGLRYTLITKNIQEENNLTVDYGALVIKGDGENELAVIPGSPADIAGIVENDIILEIDNKRINENLPLQNAIQEKRFGDTVELKVLSKGEEKTITIELKKF